MDPKLMALRMISEEMPKLEISSDDLKEVKDFKTGEKHIFEVTATMTESKLEEDEKICAEFCVDKIKLMK